MRKGYRGNGRSPSDLPTFGGPQDQLMALPHLDTHVWQTSGAANNVLLSQMLLRIVEVWPLQRLPRGWNWPTQNRTAAGGEWRDAHNIDTWGKGEFVSDRGIGGIAQGGGHRAHLVIVLQARRHVVGVQDGAPGRLVSVSGQNVSLKRVQVLADRGPNNSSSSPSPRNKKKPLSDFRINPPSTHRLAAARTASSLPGLAPSGPNRQHARAPRSGPRSPSWRCRRRRWAG